MGHFRERKLRLASLPMAGSESGKVRPRPGGYSRAARPPEAPMTFDTGGRVRE